jgi:hypothetical protein
MAPMARSMLMSIPLLLLEAAEDVGADDSWFDVSSPDIAAAVVDTYRYQ